MNRPIFCTLGLAVALAAGAAFGQDVKLVYPSDAASIELDNSTPAKRIEPPVREASESDVVTPLGQVSSVLNTLANLEEGQARLEAKIERELASIKGIDVSGIVEELARARAERGKIAEEVSTIGKAVASGAVASVARSTRDALTDFCVFLIVFLVLIQVAAKVVIFAVKWTKKKREERDNAIAARALEQYKRETTSAGAGSVKETPTV